MENLHVIIMDVKINIFSFFVQQTKLIVIKQPDPNPVGPDKGLCFGLLSYFCIKLLFGLWSSWIFFECNFLRKCSLSLCHVFQVDSRFSLGSGKRDCVVLAWMYPHPALSICHIRDEFSQLVFSL